MCDIQPDENIVQDFYVFNHCNNDPKHMITIQSLLQAVAEVKDFRRVCGRNISEKEALEEILEAGLAYHSYLDQKKDL